MEKGKEVLLEVPAHEVDRVLVFGAVQISTQALGFLLDSGIELSFHSMNGRFRGKLTPPESKNVFLRLAQYERSRDEEFKLRIAREIIAAKLKNQRTLLLRYQRNHSEADFAGPLRTIAESLDGLPAKKAISALMGLEGTSSAAYFECLSEMLSPPFNFDKRTRRPPLDPANALLSLGYTFLTNEVASMVESAGFDPFIGFIHGLRYGRQSLPLDMVEEFRHPVVDGLALNLLNKASLKEADFQPQADGGFLLQKPAFSRFLAAYEDRMQRPFQWKEGGSETTFRKLIRRQVEKMEGVVLDKKEYQPFLVQ